jgi:hypothetical protein
MGVGHGRASNRCLWIRLVTEQTETLPDCRGLTVEGIGLNVSYATNGGLESCAMNHEL